MCVLGRGVCVMDGWRLVPEKSNLNTLRWDKEGKDPVFWDRTCPRDEQEEPPLVVGGLLLDGAWRSTLGPKLTCKGRVVTFPGGGRYDIRMEGEACIMDGWTLAPDASTASAYDCPRAIASTSLPPASSSSSSSVTVCAAWECDAIKGVPRLV